MSPMRRWPWLPSTIRSGLCCSTSLASSSGGSPKPRSYSASTPSSASSRGVELQPLLVGLRLAVVQLAAHHQGAARLHDVEEQHLGAAAGGAGEGHGVGDHRLVGPGEVERRRDQAGRARRHDLRDRARPVDADQRPHRLVAPALQDRHHDHVAQQPDQPEDGRDRRQPDQPRRTSPLRSASPGPRRRPASG